MAVRRLEQLYAYGVGDSLIPLAPLPIIARRDPSTNDLAQLGTVWCNEVTGAVFMLSSISSNSANWATSAVSGNIIALDVEITTGDLTIDPGAGGIIINTNAFTVDNSGNVSIAGTLDVAGTVTITGDIDFSSTALIDLTSTLDAAPSILLHADGGTSEQILLHADQGTSVSSVELLSDVGGITLRATGLATADAINLEAPAGGIDMDSALLMSLTSSRNNAQAILIEATAGGIDILASSASAGEDIDIVATGSSVNVTSTEDAALAIYLHANGGTSETVQIHSDQGTGVASVNVLSDVGGITLRATGLASADAINLEAVAGGIDADAALQVNVASSQAAVNALRFVASDAAGGIDIDCGTGGIAVDSTGAFSIDGAAASNVTVTGAGVDLTLASVLGSVLVSSTEDAALAIRLHANGGTSETIQIHSDQGTGVGSINLLSDVGGLTLRSTGLASADAINLEAAAGGIDVDAALQINIASSQNAADSIVITSSVGGIDILAAGASAGEDIDIVATGSSVNVTATEAVADAIVLNASNAAGGIDLLTGGGEITISSAGNVTMAPGTDTQASPSATAVINARVFKATFTGFTTAAAGVQDFTITNSAFGIGDGVFVCVSNAGANDAQMTITRVNGATAGSIVVSTKNNGAAALNGNVVITGWIID